MATQSGKAPTDYFVESLGRLTDKGGPLQTTLAHLRNMQKAGKLEFPDDLEGCLKSVDRDLNAISVGTKRVMQQIEQLEGLVHTSALINSSLDVVKVLEEVMDTAIKLTNAERAYLVLREGDGDELALRAARNWDRESLPEGDVTFSRGVIQSALETGEPILTVNAQGDSRFQGNESVLVHDLRSILCIPLTLKGRVIGVLYADNRFAQGIFDEGSIPLLTAFGHQAAVAIGNAQHFMRVKADLDEAKREVSRLQIEIDEQRLNRELNEITESEYFQRLSGMAQDLRKRRS